MESTKRKPLMNLDGFIFRMDKRCANGGWYWRCINRQCLTRAHSDDAHQNGVQRGNNHNHGAENEQINVRSTITRLRRRAATETASVHSIYQQETAHLDNATQAACPTLHSIDASMYRARQRTMPVIPLTREALVINEPFSLSHAGENFLQASLNNNSILIFCTTMCLQMLFVSGTIFMDGTFIAVPHMFQQMFTLHTMCNGRLMPRVYLLMATKSRQSYIDIFRYLRDKAVTMQMVFQPNVVYSDFETGIIAAIAHEFPGAHHQGCYFHFKQAIWRNIQRLGLVRLYNENGPHRSIMRKLMALAFLPLVIVRNNFQILRDMQPVDQLLEPLFDYFVNQWFYGVPPIMWNVGNVDMRTNNYVEGWNHKFNAAVRRRHANIWHFIICLQNEQAATELAQNQHAAGLIIAAPRKMRYVRLQQRIQRIQLQFQIGEIDAQALLQNLSQLIGEF